MCSRITFSPPPSPPLAESTGGTALAGMAVSAPDLPLALFDCAPLFGPHQRVLVTGHSRDSTKQGLKVWLLVGC